MAVQLAEGTVTYPELPLADSVKLSRALADANIPTLLAAYVHLSHDETLLERFAAFIKPAFSPDAVPIPDDSASDLRNAMHSLLTTGAGMSTTPPSDRLVQRIMSVTVGEPVEDEFLELVYDQCGFRPWIDRSRIEERRLPPAGFKVLVIGAGLTGISPGYCQTGSRPAMDSSMNAISSLAPPASMLPG